jgi:dTDP-4-dehydrorhamnose 3,5-epimerase-like enzyme
VHLVAEVITLPTHRDPRGSLTVIEKILPFTVQRVYYIYGCSDAPRGGHRHHVNSQALVCVHGNCVIDWDDGRQTGATVLDAPDRLLLLRPEDWHVMRDFSPDAVLLVLASHHFEDADYIDEGYDRR